MAPTALRAFLLFSGVIYVNSKKNAAVLKVNFHKQKANEDFTQQNSELDVHPTNLLK